MAAIPPTARIADTCLDGRVVVGVLSSYALTSLTLGAGGQAKVKRGIAIPATGGMDDDAAVVVPPGTRIAVKLIRKWKMGFEPPTLSIRPGAFSGSVPRKLAELYAEHRCLEVLQSTTFHPNIVRHYETVWDVQLRKKPSVWKPERIPEPVCAVVFEEACGGTMLFFLMAGPLPERIAKAVFRQLLEAIKFCHSRNVFHRDLKPDNLVLTRGYDVQLTDFGLAVATDAADSPLRGYSGTEYSMAPEVYAFKRDPVAPAYFGGPADVWGLGVVLTILLTGALPFGRPSRSDLCFSLLLGGNEAAMWDNIRSRSGGTIVTEDAKRFVGRFLRVDTPARPSVESLLTDSWLTSDPATPAEVRTEFERRWDVYLSLWEGDRNDKCENRRRSRAAWLYNERSVEDLPPYVGSPGMWSQVFLAPSDDTTTLEVLKDRFALALPEFTVVEQDERPFTLEASVKSGAGDDSPGAAEAVVIRVKLFKEDLAPPASGLSGAEAAASEPPLVVVEVKLVSGDALAYGRVLHTLRSATFAPTTA